jgi:hypothetical protein
VSEEQAQYPDKVYESYIKEREHLFDAALNISERFEKWLLTLAGGGLALSITFLEKIAPHPSSNTAFLILFSWISLVISMVCGLFALWTSQNAVMRQIEISDLSYKGFLESSDVERSKSENNLTNNYSIATKCLTIFSMFSVIIGIIFLCAFSYGNMPQQTSTVTNPPIPKSKINDNKSDQNVRKTQPVFIPPAKPLSPPSPPEPQPQSSGDKKDS